MIEGTQSVGELVAEFKMRFSLKRKIKEEQETKMMVGRSNYQFLDPGQMRQTLSKHREMDRNKFVESVAKN